MFVGMSLQEPRSPLTPAPIRRPDGVTYDGGGFRGIPGVEVTASGRIWVTWYGGGNDEGSQNLALLARSDDDGRSWSAPLAMVDPPGNVRAYDPVLWMDPRGRLWWFWNQCESLEGSPAFDGRGGVFAAWTADPDAGESSWSAPARLCNGIMMNKPTVRADGAWLLPAAIWADYAAEITHRRFPELAGERFSNVFVSWDEGRGFVRLGGADVPGRTCDEHMIVERRDGSLWMPVRTRHGIGESFSADGGRTWTPGLSSRLPGPGSRFHLRRLRSGNLLFISHAGDPTAGRDNGNGGVWTGRSHLTAWLSDDDGDTWPWRLELDERGNVSYPDAAQDAAGNIVIVYDRERYRCGEILLARVAEHDIRSGGLVTPGSYLRRPMTA